LHSFEIRRLWRPFTLTCIFAHPGRRSASQSIAWPVENPRFDLDMSNVVIDAIP